MDNAKAIECLRVIKFHFLGDVAASEKALARKSCKDPAWHRLRVSVRTEDVEALDLAIAALKTEGPI